MTAQIIPVAVFDLVVFGATGDLSFRKLMPALYWRESDQQMPEGSRIVGVARSHLTTEEYVHQVEAACRQHVGEAFDPAVFARLAQRITYVALDVASHEHWADLAAVLAGAEDRPRLFYLATSPDLFGPICEGAGAAGIVTPLARVVLEKPIGRDLQSAISINDQVGRVFDESQVYRIDHYLGKESVQNLLALRFANSLFEAVWSRDHIDHVQITVAETVGVEERAAYYDKSGALRDMVQNHMLQLLCLVAMEPPISMAADAVRDEKLKVLHSLRPMVDGEAVQRTVRGQYRAGAGAGAAVPGYAEELGAPSRTETFVALKAEVENWRWSGVPFYLRTGKRLPTRVSEIVIQFHTVPHSIFPRAAGSIEPNRLIIRLQPDDGIQLELMAKDPGPGGMRLRNAPLDIRFADAFKVRYPDAYERLLMDVVRGNATLFMRRDEVEAAWRWVEPIIEAWAASEESPRPYLAGSWGPTAAIALIERDGRTWFEDPH
ncbi:MAG: glucose-6-phosphate dehydrogenase [Geminicoccaceae bacterium]